MFSRSLTADDNEMNKWSEIKKDAWESEKATQRKRDDVRKAYQARKRINVH